jgi:hypothetical protein
MNRYEKIVDNLLTFGLSLTACMMILVLIVIGWEVFWWQYDEIKQARMVKLVDTRDLKSLDESCTGSTPVPGTIK